MNLANQLRNYRPLLWAVAAVGFFGLNGVFLYNAFLYPDIMADALQNPVGVVFILEAFLMTTFAAWIVWLSGLEKPGWLSFIILSIVGSLAFSVPAFLLLHLRKHADEHR